MKKANHSVSQYEKMVSSPIPRLILGLSVPTIISMLVTNIYNLVDTAFVGQLGTSASGAVGIVFGFMSVIQAFGFMFGQGAGSILSRALGQKDEKAASLHASTGFFMSFFCGVLVSLIGVIFLDDIVYLLGSTPTIAPYAKTYISYILVAAPFMCSCLTLNNILRYEGRATLGMIGLMTGAVLNMAGDPILMFGCNMGIAGAGLSTAISQIVSWGVLLAMFLLKKTQTRLSWKNVMWKNPRAVLNIMATGFPSLLRQGLNSLTTMLLNLQCAPYGDAAVAAMSIVSRLIFFAFSMVIGIGQGFQPVSGYNYGAAKYERLRKAFRFTLALSEGVVILASAALIIFSGGLIGLFRDDPDVIAIGTRALRLQAGAMIVLPICSTAEMLYQSTGHRVGASLLSCLRSGVLFIPLLFLMAWWRGMSGIQEAQPIAQLLTVPIAVVFELRFFRKLK